MAENGFAVRTKNPINNIINIAEIYGIGGSMGYEEARRESDRTMETLVNKFLQLSPENQKRALELFENFEKQAALDAIPTRFEEIKARYIPFPNNEKLTVDNIQTHLKAQLGNDLKKFGAQENNVYLDELRKIEPRTEQMCQKLKRDHYKDESSPLMRDIIPKKSERITKRLKEFVVTDKTTLNEYHRNKSVEHKRRKYSKNLPIPERSY